jgi:hypothetical protein
MNNLAPIILFTYKRLETLKLTINALLKNNLVSDSDLIIYSDGPKSFNDIEIIDKIRLYLNSLSGFKSITLNYSEINLGLSKSIIYGVTATLEKYNKVIVLEDDLITSSNFLVFMNYALDKYESIDRIFSISGYTFDFNTNDFEEDGYFLNRTWPWGWATWKNRWNKVDWSVPEYQNFKLNKNLQKKFSYLGSDVNSMLDKQQNGLLDSWSIRWTFHVFLKNGLVLFPKTSKIINNGWDEFATNNKGLNDRYITSFDVTNNFEFNIPDEIKINQKFQKLFLSKMNIKVRLFNKIKESFKIFKNH